MKTNKKKHQRRQLGSRVITSESSPFLCALFQKGGREEAFTAERRQKAQFARNWFPPLFPHFSSHPMVNHARHIWQGERLRTKPNRVSVACHPCSVTYLIISGINSPATAEQTLYFCSELQQGKQGPTNFAFQNIQETFIRNVSMLLNNDLWAWCCERVSACKNLTWC